MKFLENNKKTKGMQNQFLAGIHSIFNLIQNYFGLVIRGGGVLYDTLLYTWQTMNPYFMSAQYKWNMDSYFHKCWVVYHHVWKKVIPIQPKYGCMEEGKSYTPHVAFSYRGWMECTFFHTPLCNKFTLVKIWKESGVLKIFRGVTGKGGRSKPLPIITFKKIYQYLKGGLTSLQKNHLEQ